MTMLALGGHAPWQTIVEPLLWAVPLALAIRRVRRAPSGSRRTWWIVAAVCALIVVDKVADLQTPAYALAKSSLKAVAPVLVEGHRRDLARAIVVTSVLAAGGAGAWLFLRRDVARETGKRIAVAGLAGLAAFLGARLVGSSARVIGETGATSAELLCWSAVVVGTCVTPPDPNP